MRHRWVKLRLHVYICVKCGAGKVNAQLPGGNWQTTFHLPSGQSVAPRHTPPCEVGEHTPRYLAKYEPEIRELT